MISLNGVQKTSESSTRIGVAWLADWSISSALAVRSPVRYSQTGMSEPTLSRVIWLARLYRCPPGSPP